VPPLPAWATRARGMRAAGVEPAPRLFLRQPPLPFGSRALVLRTDTGGGIRTLKNRRLRTVRQPFAPLPRVMLAGGLEPPFGHRGPGALNAVRLPFTPHQPKPFEPLRGKESNL